MLRGTKVHIKGKPRMRGKKKIDETGEGIVLERMPKSGYIRVLERYEGWLTDVCYPENLLEVLEPPIEM